MKHLSPITFALIFTFLLTGCPQPTGPDLVVCNYVVGTPAAVNNNIEVPVTVTVCNNGNAAANVFKVSLHYYDATGAGPYTVAFDVPGQTNMWYPYTNGVLAAGGSVTFTGNAVFSATLGGTAVDMWAWADSCSGDEFMPGYCRVDERNENNNTSQSVNVALP